MKTNLVYMVQINLTQLKLIEFFPEVIIKTAIALVLIVTKSYKAFIL